MKNWKNKPPVVLTDKNGIEFSVGQNIRWYSVPKGQTEDKRQLRKGSIKRIYPDGFLLVLGRHGKTRLDPRATEIEVDTKQVHRFLHGDQVLHSDKGYGVFIRYADASRRECLVSFGPVGIPKQTDRGEVVVISDLRVWDSVALFPTDP